MIKKFRSSCVFILMILYISSILSLFLTHVAHELHHLLTHTMHLHHSHHHHQQGHQVSETDHPFKTHGHRHTVLIDVALHTVNEDDVGSDEHTPVIISLFEHLTAPSQVRNLRIHDDFDFWSQNNTILFTQYIPEPPSPPPKVGFTSFHTI